MEEIINALLDKPLAFIVTIGGVIFLGLSGLTKAFNIEVNTTNSKRLFIAGISLVITGIPIHYYSENEMSPELNVKLQKVEFFKNDIGHICHQPYSLHVRETFQIDNADGEKLTKVILNQNKVHTRDIIYQDSKGNYALNYCFKPDTERIYKIVIVSNSGKTSKILKYNVNTMDGAKIQKNAPELSKY